MLPRPSLLEPQSPLSTGGGSQSLSFFLFCRLSSWVVRQAGGFDFVSAEKGNSLYGLRELGNPLSDPLRCSPPPHLRSWTHHYQKKRIPSGYLHLPFTGSHPKTKPPKKPEGNLESQCLPLGNGE